MMLTGPGKELHEADLTYLAQRKTPATIYYTAYLHVYPLGENYTVSALYILDQFLLSNYSVTLHGTSYGMYM